MALPDDIRTGLSLPAICAPMFLISGPDLARESCKAGIMGVLPRHNAQSIEQFEEWLFGVRDDLDAYVAQGGSVAPLATNVTLLAADETQRFFDACTRARVDIVISAFGNPTEHIQRVHDRGMRAFHDVTNIRFAEKALAAGADGLIGIGAGGGGHSGTVSHLALIPRLRQMFDGVLVMAGAVTNGAAIRAAEILGADLAYLGTRFIASQESMAQEAYKQLLVSGGTAELIYTANPTGVPANWLRGALQLVGLDPDNLPERTTPRGPAHLPETAKPWKDLWSAGQGIELIDDIPTVAELAGRLRREYLAACATPDFAEAARLAEQASDLARAG
jgi:nitronate monooxygenase